MRVNLKSRKNLLKIPVLILCAMAKTTNNVTTAVPRDKVLTAESSHVAKTQII